VYGGLFLIAGLLLLAVTYFLVSRNLAMTGRAMPARKLSDVSGITIAKNSDGSVLINTLTEDAFRKGLAQSRQSALNSMLTQGGLALLFTGAAAFGLGWLFAGRALRPVHQVTETARRVALSHNLGERIAFQGPNDDIKELADTFDTMMERLDRSFDGQRRFVANASHELRTPLAINRTLVDVAVRRSDATADVRRLGESLLIVNARHERLIDGLLALAGSENVVVDPRRVELDELTARILDQLEDMTVHRSLAPASTEGDPVLLERLVQNLVENAVRHNDERRELWVETRRNGEVVIANTGPRLAMDQMETIFEPFRRLNAERIGSEHGSGLGLSIVRAVARAHGGTVSATPREGGGLVVEVYLPSTTKPHLLDAPHRNDLTRSS
jgi:signal transduction histidine kinase